MRGAVPWGAHVEYRGRVGGQEGAEAEHATVPALLPSPLVGVRPAGVTQPPTRSLGCSCLLRGGLVQVAAVRPRRLACGTRGREQEQAQAEVSRRRLMARPGCKMCNATQDPCSGEGRLWSSKTRSWPSISWLASLAGSGMLLLPHSATHMKAQQAWAPGLALVSPMSVMPSAPGLEGTHLPSTTAPAGSALLRCWEPTCAGVRMKVGADGPARLRSWCTTCWPAVGWARPQGAAPRQGRVHPLTLGLPPFLRVSTMLTTSSGVRSS